MSTVTLQVNGATHEVDVDPATPLLYVLRNDLDLHGPRFGCGMGQCSVCTVIIDGVATRSCITPVSAVRGKITTLEGLSKNGKLHPLQQAWIEEQAAQCGYCQNGQIMTAKALLDKNPNPSDAQIREAMDGALCRCTDVLPRAVRDSALRAREQGRRKVSNTLQLPKEVEDAVFGLVHPSRRGFLQGVWRARDQPGCGCAGGLASARRGSRRRLRRPAPIPIRTTCRWIRGS